MAVLGGAVALVIIIMTAFIFRVPAAKNTAQRELEEQQRQAEDPASYGREEAAQSRGRRQRQMARQALNARLSTDMGQKPTPLVWMKVIRRWKDSARAFGLVFILG